MLKPTYAKRAQQLVKNGRAVWVSTDTIRLERQPEEANDMELTTFEESAIMAEDSVQKAAEVAAMDDKVILNLAKRRLAVKRNLLGQLLDYLLLIFFMILVITLMFEEERAVACMVFAGFWGVRLLIRAVKFIRPSFKEGIVAYFRNRKKRRLESEYDRLRKLSAESLAAEFDNTQAV